MNNQIGLLDTAETVFSVIICVKRAESVSTTTATNEEAPSAKASIYLVVGEPSMKEFH